MSNAIKAVAFDLGHTLVNEGKFEGVLELMPGVHEVLPQIDLPMSVWANTRAMREMELRQKLQEAQIQRYFSAVVTSVDAGFRKPAAEFFEFALGKWLYTKEEILFVCNQLNTDVLGARRYGIQTAWISAPEFRSGDETMTLDEVTPTFIIQGLKELPALLQRICAPRAV
jgi:putative hydrolase of the HAD superfamily